MLLLLITMAQAKPLSSAEFEDTGHTLAPGQKQIDLFRSSQFAISDELELNTVILGAIGRDTKAGWFAGPNAGVEYAIQEGKQGALSVGANLATNWQFNSQTVGGNVTWTKGGAVKNRINLSGGLSLATVKIENIDRVNTLGTNLYASYHIVPSKKTTWRIYGGIDPLNTGRSETFVGTLGFDWNHGMGDSARIMLGLRLQSTDRYVAALNEIDADSSWVPAVFPVPTANVFFTW